MKAIDFLDGLTKEGRNFERCGVVKGSCINDFSPRSFFGIIENIPSSWFDDTSYYFYFYGEWEFTFRFLPDSWRFFPIDAEKGVYVWEIDN